MAWIELHQTLPTNKKTIRLKNLLRIKVPQAVGHLCILWLWALDNAPDGDLSGFTADEIAEFAQWPGKSPEEFLGALISAGFVDENMRIHDWQNYAGKLVEKRKSDAERKRAYRTNRTGHPLDVQRTSPGHPRDGAGNSTVPNSTIHNSTVPDIESPPISPSEDAPACAGDGVVIPKEPAQTPESKPKRKNPSSLTKAQETRFNRFWAAYPKKVSIGDAEKAWAKISPDDALTERIIEAVETAKEKDSRFRERRFTPHPATWLNRRDWENQYDGPEPPPPQHCPGFGGRPNTLGILEAMLTEGGDQIDA